MILRIKKNWFLFLLVIFVACTEPNSKLYPDDISLRTVPVFFISHGWHTGIVFEEEYFINQLSKSSQFPKGRYLMFEWGDGKYFPHNDPGTALLLRAALLPTKSVMHVTGMNSSPDYTFPNSTVIQINVTPEGVQSLSEFIGQQFRKGTDGQLMFTDNGLYPNSKFFEAEMLYFFPRTSNFWTAKALRKTGYPISPLWSLTAGNVAVQVKKDGIILQ